MNNNYTKYAVISKDNVIKRFFFAKKGGDPVLEERSIKAKDFMRVGMKLKEVEGKLVEDKIEPEKKGFWPFR